MLKSVVAKSYPKIEDLMKLSENTNGAYGYAFLNIFPSVYGRVQHKANFESRLQSKIFNETDEALALVLLENSMEMWSETSGNITEPKYTVRFKTRGDESTLSSGDSTEEKHKTGYGGWSYVGIKRYMEILSAVKADRATTRRKELEVRFLEEARQAMDITTTRKTPSFEQLSLEQQLMHTESTWLELVVTEEDDILMEGGDGVEV